jgi:hypothetical protein
VWFPPSGGSKRTLTFDGRPAIEQNVRVRRLILLAIGVSLLLWTLSVRTVGFPSGDIATMSAEAPLLVGAPQPASDTDEHWRAPHQPTVSVSGSFWTSPQFHAELATAPTARLFDSAHVSTPPDPPARSAPHYLRHTPLLI